MVEQKQLISKLKTAIAEGKVDMGSKEAIKNLKTKQVGMIILSKNCPEQVRKDIERYANMVEVEVQNFDGTSKELGIICGKPFPVAAITIK